MAIFRTVEFWPSMGSTVAPWCDTAEEDAFVRSARSVCELYSEALPQARIKARDGSLRFSTIFVPERDVVRVVVFVDPTDGFEMARAELPPGIDDLSASTRAGLVLDVVHGACLRLAQARGWETQGLLEAREHVLAQGLRYRWSSPWKASPGRRHEGRAVYELHDDGFGRVVLELRERGGGASLRSAPGLAYSTLEGFKRSAATLRWRSRDAIVLVPYAPFFGEDEGQLTLTTAGESKSESPLGVPLRQAGGGVAASTRAPAVVVMGDGVDAPEAAGPRMSLGGGGPMNDVPEIYAAALDHFLGAINADPYWHNWWADADVDILEGGYWFAANQVRATARRGRNKLTVGIERPVGTFSAATDLVGLAVEDVERLLELIERRMGLPPHPALPERQTVATAIAAAHARREAVLGNLPRPSSQ